MLKPLTWRAPATFRIVFLAVACFLFLPLAMLAQVALGLSIVVSLPVMIGFAFLQRFFIQGLTAGAVKS